MRHNMGEDGLPTNGAEKKTRERQRERERKGEAAAACTPSTRRVLWNTAGAKLRSDRKCIIMLCANERCTDLLRSWAPFPLLPMYLSLARTR